ncbi:MAG TPA: 12-oxophytodienoate reductase, partial [Alcanivorax sp.]|nr:12-oxophytodienoate reductase [Alcanivorax sp.]
DEFDLIAVGRALLQDPNWLVKMRNGQHDEIEPFTKAALGSLS